MLTNNKLKKEVHMENLHLKNLKELDLIDTNLEKNT